MNYDDRLGKWVSMSSDGNTLFIGASHLREESYVEIYKLDQPLISPGFSP